MFSEKTMEASSITGIGAYALGTAVGSFQPWRTSNASGSVSFYYAENGDGTIWEAGYGTLTYGTPDTLSRNVLASSTGAAINWQSTDAPIYVMSVPTAAALKHLILGGRATARPAWAQKGLRWLDESDANAWTTTRAIDKLYNGTADAELGRYEAAAGIYVASPRRPTLATGTADLTVTANHIGWRFTFDTSAAPRAMTLPAIATVDKGFELEGLGLSSANGVVITPNGSEVVDFGAGGATLTVPGRVPFKVWSDGTQWRTNYVAAAVVATRGHIHGLTLSTAGSSATFGVAAGIATDSTFVDLLTLGSAYTKTTSAWAVGSAAGSLDTGAIASNTWYHVWLIKRPDTGVVDVLTSLSATAPTMPANYTLKRRIGSMKTGGSSQWVAFIQNGDKFLWLAPPNDVSTTTLGTSPTSFTMSVPPGIVVDVLTRAIILFGSNVSAMIYSPNINAQAVATQGTGPVPSLTVIVGSGNSGNGQQITQTNTSSQINAVASAAGVALYITTDGWLDRRGRDS